MCKPIDFRHAGDRQCRVLCIGEGSQSSDVDPIVGCEQDWRLHYRVGWGYGARSETLDHAVVAGPALKRVWNLGYEVVACLAGKHRTRSWETDGQGEDEDQLRMLCRGSLG